MGVLDALKGFIDPFRVEARSGAPFTVSYEYPNLQTQISTLTGWRRGHGWGPPSIQDALGVPAILRCVTLISNTTGQLTVQGFRDGSPMPDSPRLITRPDPWRTPRDFYRDSAYNMATRGEVVWYIASTDGDGLASALVVVPLRELHIEENTGDRMRPLYRWGNGTGSVESTRWTPANPSGKFVHVTYLQEPGDLRGNGPLQLAGAATTVSVEAQQWAANFYARGGYPSVVMSSEDDISDDDATSLKEQWTNNPNNTPLVTSGAQVAVHEFGVNPQGAQMLEARSHQDGEAARMFGMPGSLVEFNAPGSSLTYQNIGEVFTLFVKTCLAPNYLEPMEQALSDLLPRSTVGRFHVDGFYRPDMKSRWEVYEIASKVLGVEEAAQWAREREGLAPGDVEYKPVLFAPPAAVPTRLPVARTAVADPALEIRCDGMVQRRSSGVAGLARCNKLLTKTGVLPDRCPRCKKVYAAA